MKIFSAAQIKACDAYTIHASSITSHALMERAAGKCVEWITAHLSKDALFVILCGTGNNGGDGLAIARMLHRLGYGVKVFLLQFSEELSADCHSNLEQLDSSLVSILQPETFITDIPENITIIDAILGTGLNRPTQGWVANFINEINELPNKKIAIDMPSGLPADTAPDSQAAIIQAHDTLSFQFYKRSFLHPETAGYVGNVHILDIGLDPTFIVATPTQYHIIDKEQIAEMYRPRSPFAHKGTFGSVLMIGGSYGKIGAITLSAKAALRTGAGLVSALIPECGYTTLQTAVPEVMCRVTGKKQIEDIKEWEDIKAIGIGPGMGTAEPTGWGFAAFIDTYKQPLVIDADALNLLARQPDLLGKIPPYSILTPHPKEFSRLFGESPNSMQQLELARAQAMRYNIFIVLKGHRTAIVTPEGDCWYNITGNAGMATGGSGDVLTGIITSLLAQGYESADAAMLGVYLHGKAGDIAAAKLSQEALIASDIIESLGAAFMSISGKN